MPRTRNRIRRLRFDAGERTQTHGADRVGVPRQTILAITNGRSALAPELAVRIARACAAPLDQVFTFHDD